MVDKKEIIDDSIEFFKTIGGAEELGDRGWGADVWLHDIYKEVLLKNYEKYIPEEFNKLNELDVDDYLVIEHNLTEFFTNNLYNL